MAQLEEGVKRIGRFAEKCIGPVRKRERRRKNFQAPFYLTGDKQSLSDISTD
mgnify:CR=1 FL=1